jgi:hypothetical protein
MKYFKKRPFINIFIITCILLALIYGAYFVVSNHPGNTEPAIEFNLSASITPTPYPLPTIVYQQSSSLTKIWGQIFGSKSHLANPAQIMQNSHQRYMDEHMDLYVQNDLPPVDPAWWQPESNQVYEYVGRRLDETIHEKVSVIFVPSQAGNCSPRGTTFQEEQATILIFIDQGTSRDQILATLAHELAHVFIHKKYENMNDPALSEGMATWAAGDYWKAWKGLDFNAAVRSYITGKTYLPLIQNYDLKKASANAPGCIVNRDMLLSEFASFIDYLIQSRGLDKLSALFDVQPPELIGARQIIFPPDYQGVYGFELNQLEQEWLRALLYP